MGLMDKLRDEKAQQGAAGSPAGTGQVAESKPFKQDMYMVDALDPVLMEAVRAVSAKTRERLMAALGSESTVDPDDAMHVARDVAARFSSVKLLDAATRERVAQEAFADLFLLGPLEPLLADESVTEIMVNAPDEIYIEQRGKLKKTNVVLRDEAQAMAIVSRIAADDDKHCDKAMPMCNCTLHRPGASFDGARVNLTVPPVAVDHAGIDIRKFRTDVVTPEALLAGGEFDRRCMLIQSAFVRARMNIIIVGGTGSGKTTLLNALSCFIPDNERIITVEDTVELKLDKEHVYRMETRQKTSEGTGEITIRDLVINTLRQRPDRIIVGECRGEEAFDMLQAMSTGHDGSLTTIHANNARHALSRLQMMIQMAESAGNMSPVDIMKVITDAVDIIVHVKRWPNGERHVDEIVEVQGCNDETGVPTLEPIVLFDEESGKWVPTGGRLTPAHRARFESNGIAIDEGWWDQWRSFEP